MSDPMQPSPETPSYPQESPTPAAPEIQPNPSPIEDPSSQPLPIDPGDSRPHD